MNSRFSATFLKLSIVLLFPALVSASQVTNGKTHSSPISDAAAISYAQTAATGVDESRQNAITRAVGIVSPAVVGINVTEIREQRLHPFWQMFYGDRVLRQPFQTAGSGFIISEDGYIITNDHVAGRASEIMVTLTDGSKHQAKLVGTDAISDIALIKLVDGENLPFLKMGNSDEVIVGEWSIAFGNPFGLFFASAKPTVTVGVVSAMHVNLESEENRVYRNMIQTDAAINHGNSGGPLVNSLGEVIGMNTVIFSPNDGNVGLGFAVPVNRIRKIVDVLKSDGTVNRDFAPGFKVQPVDQAIADAYNLKRVDGAIVTTVFKNSAAKKAGLEVADIILSANGEPVYSVAALEGMIAYAVRGETVTLNVLRNNTSVNIDLVLK